MKKTLINVDKERGVWQVTTSDERVYLFPAKDPETGLPTYKAKPSSTYVLAVGYPKGRWFQEWLKKNGDDAELIKMIAGERGSKIHQAVEQLMSGTEVKMEDMFTNPTSEAKEGLAPDEYEAIVSFKGWWDSLTSKAEVNVLGVEFSVNSDKYDYAGTVDMLLEIGGELWLIDLKTGQNVYEDYILQVSSYKQALAEKPKFKIGENEIDISGRDIKTAILQVGYTRNKDRFKLTEVEDKFPVFLHAKGIFDNEVKNLPYKQVELPLTVKVDLEKKPTEKVEGAKIINNRKKV